MKSIVLLLSLLASTITYSQDYNLIPDTCTYCAHKVSTGGNSWNNSFYKLDPNVEITHNGNAYTQITWGNWSGGWGYPLGVRQVGNKLYGAIQDSLSDFLIMDFDAQIGDTIYDLYSEGFLYNAKVTGKDSVLVNNGAYHHYMLLDGFDITENGGPAAFAPSSWSFSWNERGLCVPYFVPNQYLYGGVVYNVPEFYVISIPFAFPAFCTPDAMYTNPGSVLCFNCNLQISSLDETTIETFSIAPNPANDELQLTFEVSGLKEVHFYTTSGALVRSIKSYSDNLNVDLTSVPSGLYIVEVVANDVLSRKKFIRE